MSSYLITHLPPNTDSSKLVEFLIRNDFVFTFGQSAEELSSWVRAKNLIYNESQKASKPPTPSLSYEEEIKPTEVAITAKKPVFEVPLYRPRVAAPFLFRTANPIQKRTEPISQRPVYKVVVAKPREVAPTVIVKDAVRFKLQQQEQKEEKPPVDEKKPPVEEEKDLTYLTGKHATLLMQEDEEDEEMIEDVDEQEPQEDPSCSTEDRSSPTTYKCHLINCGMEFSRQSLLVEHMELHPGEQPFRCNVCGKQYSQSGSLNRHMRLHTGEHPYECNYCEKKFTHPEQLKCHLRTHTGEKPYECEICKRRFTQSHSLKEHLRLHTGEKPYECTYCKRKFNHQGTLQKHLRVHTGEKPYECYVCLKKFKHSAYLKQHLWVIHATVPKK